jgi:hypothetical protein
MSTNSHIGIENADGTVTYIYGHFDGMVVRMGGTLQESYNSAEAVNALMAMGDMSILGDNLAESIFYTRDRGEAASDNMAATVADRHEFSAVGGYVYLFSTEMNSWTVKTPGRATWVGLRRALETV